MGTVTTTTPPDHYIELARWIPCSEQLPKTGVEVLVDDGVSICVMKLVERPKGQLLWSFIALEYFPLDRVIAWMYLPKAYHKIHPECSIDL